MGSGPSAPPTGPAIRAGHRPLAHRAGPAGPVAGRQAIPTVLWSLSFWTARATRAPAGPPVVCASLRGGCTVGAGCQPPTDLPTGGSAAIGREICGNGGQGRRALVGGAATATTNTQIDFLVSGASLPWGRPVPLAAAAGVAFLRALSACARHGRRRHGNGHPGVAARVRSCGLFGQCLACAQ